MLVFDLDDKPSPPISADSNEAACDSVLEAKPSLVVNTIPVPVPILVKTFYVITLLEHGKTLGNGQNSVAVFFLDHESAPGLETTTTGHDWALAFPIDECWCIITRNFIIALHV